MVAAAIINPDRHWHAIVNYYDDLALNWLGPEEFDVDLHGHFVFHALDVWHGSGIFHRQRFSLQERMKIFRQMAQAPDLLAIPISFGIVEKDSLPANLKQGNHTRQKQTQHGLAFGIAMQGVDLWMEKNCRGEVCMVTAEDTDTVKKALQVVHFSSQNRGLGYEHENVRMFRSRSLVDSINFADKRFSPIMQMADHCAFIIRRSLTDCPYISEYLDMITPALFGEHLDKLRSFRVFANR